MLATCRQFRLQLERPLTSGRRLCKFIGALLKRSNQAKHGARLQVYAHHGVTQLFQLTWLTDEPSARTELAAKLEQVGEIWSARQRASAIVVVVVVG